jgi:hypothetical protein
MTVDIAPGYVAVPTANNTGTTLCTSDAAEQVTLPAAPAAGTDRIDLIVCHARGTDLDGGVNNDFVFESVQGVPAASPVAPATPPGMVALAQVYLVGGSAAVDPAKITNVRPPSLVVPSPTDLMPRGYVTGYRMQPASDVTGAAIANSPNLNVPMLAGRRYRITLTGRGSTSAAGGASIRIAGPGFPSGPWANYQMVIEKNNAANEGLSGTGVTFYDCTTAGSYAFNLGFYGGGTVKVLGGSCSATAEDIGGF